MTSFNMVSNGTGATRDIPKIINAWDIYNRPAKQWLVKDWVLEETLTYILGKPGIGKSFLALDLAYSVAMGEPWLGQEVIQKDVLYILGERPAIQPRLDALRIKKRIDIGAVEIVEEGIMLDDPGPRGDLMTAIRTAVEQRTLPNLGVVFIDTQRTCFGGSELSDADAETFIRGLREIRAELGCATVVVHHPPKEGNTLRGSGVFTGAADHIIQVDGDSTSPLRSLTLDKANDGEPGKAMYVERVVVETTFDRNSIVFSRIADFSKKPGDGNTAAIRSIKKERTARDHRQRIMELLKDNPNDTGWSTTAILEGLRSNNQRGMNRNALDQIMQKLVSDGLIESSRNNRGTVVFRWLGTAGQRSPAA